MSHFFLYYFFITQHVFLIYQMVSALQWLNNQNRLRGHISMPPPIVPSKKVRPHTWSLEKKNPRKALSSTTGPSMWYFISIPRSSGAGNAEIYSGPTCWWWSRERYDFYYSRKWDSSMLWIVCKHWVEYTSYLKPSTTILSLVPLFTHIRCNLRHFCYNPTTTKFIWTKQFIFYPTSFYTIFHQFFRLTSIWCYWGSNSPILEYPYSRAYIINPTKWTWVYNRPWLT